MHTHFMGMLTPACGLAQVLGNTELRERYDAHGAQGLDVNFMDASEFFTMLFGSDKFEHLLGELMIAAAARNGGDFSLMQLKKLQVGALMKLLGSWRSSVTSVPRAGLGFAILHPAMAPFTSIKHCLGKAFICLQLCMALRHLLQLQCSVPTCCAAGFAPRCQRGPLVILLVLCRVFG